MAQAQLEKQLQVLESQNEQQLTEYDQLNKIAGQN
jgi:hypothetical protein